jgi:hypothetical protein
LKNNQPIKSSKELDDLIKEKINKVLNNPELEEQFEKIDKALRPKNIQSMKNIIEEDKSLLLELINYDEFQRKYWKSHFSKIIDEVVILRKLYAEKREEIEEIIEEANKESDEWSLTIDIFKERFSNLPFEVKPENTKDSTLGLNKPELSFYFIDLDTKEKKKVERDFLTREILSQGEKRAFYLLNIIFEIRARLLKNQKTLFIIDDIADSFDYKNKYAIVEYLHDISREPNFCSIILTHNFDFYRTITSRFDLQRNCKLHAIRTKDEIKIIQEVYQNLPFRTWRENMKRGQYYDKTYSDVEAKKHIIALIPFVRNMIEYSGSTDSTTSYGDDFNALTCLLHSKNDTKNITFNDLKLIYKKHINNDDFDQSINGTELIYDELLNLASTIGDNEFNLENKIILAMAIRHKAEEYMLSKNSNQDPIGGCQTKELFERYKGEFDNDASHKDAIRILESVIIMTPENIHLNSFMYEPILDMSIGELKKLYEKVSNL